MSVALFREIVRLRPDWRDTDDARGIVKLVISSHYSDSPEWRGLVGGPASEGILMARFRDPADPFALAVVCDKWLTGLDAPALSTLYLCKLMRGHVLMQAISRVSRPHASKHGALVVDYLDLSHELNEAMTPYMSGSGLEVGPVDLQVAIAQMLEKHRVCVALMRGFDWSGWSAASPAQRLAMLPPAQDHILRQPGGKQRLTRAVEALWRDFTLVVPHPEATRIRVDVEFLLSLRASLNASAPGAQRGADEIGQEAREFLRDVVDWDAVTDVFASAGVDAPSGGRLDEDLLRRLAEMSYPHLASELLRKLVQVELQSMSYRNLSQARAVASKRDSIVLEYDERSIPLEDALRRLVALARDLRLADKRCEELGLTEDELAFHDALNADGSVAHRRESDVLKKMAREIAALARGVASSDWSLSERARNRMRSDIRRILQRYRYPHALQRQAIRRVLEQAALNSERGPAGE